MVARKKIGAKKKIAFVCSGGATKAGAFHLGVALALQEQGFRFYGGEKKPENDSTSSRRPPGSMEISTYVGSSAGSIIATFLAGGFSLDNIFNSFTGRDPIAPEDAVPRPLPRLTYPMMFKMRPGIAKEQILQLKAVRKFAKNFSKLFMAGQYDDLVKLSWLTASGIFSTHGIEQYIREEVLDSNQFKDYLADLFIVATQLNHSRKVVFGKYSYKPPSHDLTCQYNNDATISQAVASSTALPVIYAPFEMQMKDGSTHWFIDGEIRDTLSTHVAMDAGADLIIASHTHQPYHMHKEVGSLTEYGIPAIVIQSIYLVIEQKINNYIHSKETKRSAILSVEKYCQDSQLDPKHTKRILEILEAELQFRRDVDTIYIHPQPEDHHLFFADHFSLSPEKMAQVVKSGFRAAIEVLRLYEFEDRKTPKEPQSP